MSTPWTLVYEGFDPASEGHREALCTLGNGYFATRGAAPESTADGTHYPGTYAAGCYNRLRTELADRTLEHESTVNLPNWLLLGFRTEDGDWFSIQDAEILEYRQELDLRRAVLVRSLRFRDQDGRVTRVTQRRFVHTSEPHLAGLQTTFVAENWSGMLTVRSGIDGRVENSNVARYKDLARKHLEIEAAEAVDAETLLLVARTTQSRLRFAQAARTRAFGNGRLLQPERLAVTVEGTAAQDLVLALGEGEQVRVEKIVALHTSRDSAISEPATDALVSVERAGDFEALLERHALGWDHRWNRCGLDIEDNERAQLILRLHIFHLLQTVSEHTIGRDAGVPARGLHGEAYRGHVFWDELFILPFLNSRLPEVTRSLLLYRYRRLPQARWAAKQEGFTGAMYPWESGSSGREEAQVVHLNPLSGRWLPDDTHLQRHINAAIAYNVWRYFESSTDFEFLSSYGAEMLVELARFWCSISSYNRSLDRYEIKGVVGPDEFHVRYPDAEAPGLHNNAYTNVMATWVLLRAREALETIAAYRRDELGDLLHLTREELERWEDVSRKMVVPFHGPGEGIISQFEGYDALEEFDFAGYARRYGDIHRLDRILEAEGDDVNRYKASKQADVLMLFYLLSAEELAGLFSRLGYSCTPETISENIEHYLDRTAHGSTLSRMVHSWVLARSDRKRSWNLFVEALEADISDVQGGTTAEGIHLGAMAGTVDLVQRCYAGIEARQDVLWFDPVLPENIRRLVFDIRYHRYWGISVEIQDGILCVGVPPKVRFPVRVGVRGEIAEVPPGTRREFKI